MHKNTIKILIYVFTVVLFIIGLCVYMYPLLSGYILEKNSDISIKNFENLRKISAGGNQNGSGNEISEFPDESSEQSDNKTSGEFTDIQKNNLLKLYNDMREYNDSIFTNGQSGLSDAWAYEQSGFDLSAYGMSEGAVAVLRIPAMNDLEMPVFLGASKKNMSRGAAQLGETSMPIGGNNTNCVIAGHRGWNGAKYFVDIEKLESGDLIYIDNLWTTMTYKVCDIQVISPNDINKILIQPNRDMVTLITCHPYMRSTSRYVVFCERITDDGQQSGNEQNSGTVNGTTSTEDSDDNTTGNTSSEILIYINRYSYIAVPIILLLLVVILKLESGVQKK